MTPKSTEMASTHPLASVQDVDTEKYLIKLAEEQATRKNRVPGVRTVLVVLSAAGMVFDVESLRQKVLLAYPDAAVFFLTTMGKVIGAVHPPRLDLLIDFTGPRQRQGWLYARKLKGMAIVSVGRNAGLFRKNIYDRIYDEKVLGLSLPTEKLARERKVQRAVLELAGVALAVSGDSAPDRGKITPMELPPFSRL